MKEEDSKLLLMKFFESRGFVGHHIDSFNHFIEYGLQKIVDEVGEIVPDILPAGVNDLKIKFGKVWVERPVFREADGSKRSILPMEARLRNLTYQAPIYMEMSLVVDGNEREPEIIHIGDLPIMLKSKVCNLYGLGPNELIKAGEDPYDPGGYFIVNGTERVIVAVEDLAPNRIFVEEQSNSPYPFVAKVFSDDGQYNIQHLFERSKEGMIEVSFSRMKRIPFVILMKALGVTKDKDIFEMVGDERFYSDLYLNLYETREIKKQDDALEFIGRKLGITTPERRVEGAIEMLDRFFFPHLGHRPDDMKVKAYYLAKVVKKLLLVSHGYIKPDDKDHYKNKRLKLAGPLMENLFRNVFRMLVGDIKYNFEKIVKRGKIPPIQSVVRSQFLTQRIRSAMATGEWTAERHGISQHMDRLNYDATVSFLRKVASLLSSAREAFEARDLHPTHWGKLCTSETPEGTNIGLRKNLAITAEITTGVEDEESVIQTLKEFGLKGVE